MRSYAPKIIARDPRVRSAGIGIVTLAGLALAPACSSGTNPTVEAMSTTEDRTLATDTGDDMQVQSTPATDVVTSGSLGNSAAATSDSSSTFAGLGDSTEGEGVNAETACAALDAAAEPNVTEVEREVVTEIVTEVDKPVALYIVLDNSGSMDQTQSGSQPAATQGAGGAGGAAQVGTGGAALLAVPPPGGAGGATAAGGAATGAGGAAPAEELTKWESAVQALTDFVNDPGSAGIEVAIQYTSPGATQDGGIRQQEDPAECDGSAQSVPAVEMGVLPDNAQAIVDSLQTSGPHARRTTTVGALIGGVEYCVNYELANPDKTCVTVIVTDGAPNGCGLDDGCGAGGGQACIDPMAEGVLTPIAAQGLVDGVTTFTVGMAGVSEAGFGLLDAIAVAGGSDCTPGAAGDEACDVSTSGAAGFLEALNTIRETVSVTETMTEIVVDTVVENVVLPCEFTVPRPTTGEPIDEDLVIVNLTVDGGEQEKLTKYADVASCAGDGWYFPDLSDLTQISACPTTCDRITAASSASIDLLLGCEDKLQ